VVIDLANSPSFRDKAVLEFFETSGRNLLAAEATAGSGTMLHYPSSDRPLRHGYFRAKVAQEKLIKASGSLHHHPLTQFMEFLRGIGDFRVRMETWSEFRRACSSLSRRTMLLPSLPRWRSSAAQRATVEIAGPERAPSTRSSPAI